MIALLVRAVTRQDARLVSADRGGDWGIDVLADDLNGKAAIWQAKHFTREVGRHQQDLIRQSFNSAVREAAAHGYSIEQRADHRTPPPESPHIMPAERPGMKAIARTPESSRRRGPCWLRRPGGPQ